MTREIVITLTEPPPSVNAIFKNVASKGRSKTKSYKAWLSSAGWEVKAQCPRRIGGRVMVDITCKRIPGRCDIDNRIKAILDLLVGLYVIDDDQYVEEVRARWGGDAACSIVITEWSAAEFPVQARAA